MGQKIIPIEKVGLYVPGGTAAYPSTVLMDSIPAKIAGCKEIVMVTPPSANGKVNPVILAAAKVGGINANNTTPAEFAYENLQIQCNVIKCCHDYKVKKLLFLGSTCIYPKMAPQPIPEDALLTGPLEETNEAYAIALVEIT